MYRKEGMIKMNVKQALINKIGCFMARYIIRNCDDGLVVTRKTGMKQVIKVYSVQAYKNVIKPAICKTTTEAGNWHKLPCKVGDTVYVRALCECVNTIDDRETGTSDCPFEYDCEFEKCENGNERIFETTISSIFNDGTGWYCALKGLCFEVSVLDFGKTIFPTRHKAVDAWVKTNEQKGDKNADTANQKEMV